MKKLVLILMLMSSFCWAAKKQAPNPADYTVVVHVTASHLQVAPGRSAVCTFFYQRLSAVIDGKKYDLTSPDEFAECVAGAQILALGDYKARLIKDEHKTTYESGQTYEFLLPDNKTMKFLVTGVAE